MKGKGNGIAGVYGVTFVPWIDSITPKGIPRHMASDDMVVRYRQGQKSTTPKLLHYLGKHVPHPQKALWSPDSPVQQDRHLFKLTTIDIDAFKYWFGVRRALITPKTWPVLAQASLVPPSFHLTDPAFPRPIFSKQELYRYYLANRKSMEEEARENYVNYENSMGKTEADREASRPRAPWL